MGGLEANVQVLERGSTSRFQRGTFFWWAKLTIKFNLSCLVGMRDNDLLLATKLRILKTCP